MVSGEVYPSRRFFMKVNIKYVTYSTTVRVHKHEPLYIKKVFSRLVRVDRDPRNVRLDVRSKELSQLLHHLQQ